MLREYFLVSIVTIGYCRCEFSHKLTDLQLVLFLPSLTNLVLFKLKQYLTGCLQGDFVIPE